MRIIDEDYAGRHFVDNSGCDALAFSQAFSSLAKLKDFDIVPSYGSFRHQRYMPDRYILHAPKTEQFFVTLLASWHAESVKPYRLRMVRGKMGW